MGFFDLFKNKTDKQESNFDKNKAERDALKEGIAETLSGLKLSQIEIHETLLIIDDAQDRIAKLSSRIVLRLGIAVRLRARWFEAPRRGAPHHEAFVLAAYLQKLHGEVQA